MKLGRKGDLMWRQQQQHVRSRCFFPHNNPYSPSMMPRGYDYCRCCWGRASLPPITTARVYKTLSPGVLYILRGCDNTAYPGDRVGDYFGSESSVITGVVYSVPVFFFRVSEDRKQNVLEIEVIIYFPNSRRRNDDFFFFSQQAGIYAKLRIDEMTKIWTNFEMLLLIIKKSET